MPVGAYAYAYYVRRGLTKPLTSPLNVVSRWFFPLQGRQFFEKIHVNIKRRRRSYMS